MDLYNATLFVHIMGAVVLVSYGFMMPLLMSGVARTKTVDGLRGWLTVLSRYSKMGPIAAVFVLASGVYMTLNAYSFTTGWIVVSLVLFVSAGAIAGGVLDKHLTHALELAEQAPDGPVTPDLRAEALSPRMANFESLMFGFDLSIVFMMTNKPGWTGSLVATAVGLTVAGVLIARRNRSRDAAALPA